MRRGMRTPVVALLVVVIVGLVAFRNVTARIARARLAAAQEAVVSYRLAVGFYMRDRGIGLPPQDLAELQEKDGDGQSYLAGGEQALVDPWGCRYRLVRRGTCWAVVSNGPDRLPETMDDVRSAWSNGSFAR